MLLIDGVRYEERILKSEEEFERVVNEHTLEIFGKDSFYFDRKLKLQSLSGIGSIPDGYAIVLGNIYQWHIVEIELSSHPLYNHIVPQIGKFITGINNPSTQKAIIDALYHAVVADELQYNRMDKDVQTGEYYKFISDIISKSPVITIVIEKDTPELHDALDSLNHPKKNIVEFRTFGQPDKQNHAHLFEPLYNSVTSSELVIDIKSSNIKNGHIRIPKSRRHFFPGYKISFDLETDIGLFKTWVSYGHGAKVGDLDKGQVIRAKLKKWYKKHPTIKIGDKVIIKAIEPMKKYRLEIVK